MPAGFTWKNPTDLVGNLDTHKVTFTPSGDDANKYLPKQNIDVTVTIGKGDQVITFANTEKTFDGDAISVSDLGLTYLGDGEVSIEYKLAIDPDTSYSTTAPNAAHEYTVKITVREGTNYVGAVKVVNFNIVLED